MVATSLEAEQPRSAWGGAEAASGEGVRGRGSGAVCSWSSSREGKLRQRRSRAAPWGCSGAAAAQAKEAKLGLEQWARGDLAWAHERFTGDGGADREQREELGAVSGLNPAKVVEARGEAKDLRLDVADLGVLIEAGADVGLPSGGGIRGVVEGGVVSVRG